MVPPGQSRSNLHLRDLFAALALVSGVIDSSAAETTLPALTNVAQLKRLTDAQAELGYPAHLQGVVTYFNGPAGLSFLQDATGGTFFSIGGTNHPPALQFSRGDLIAVDGETLPGRFVPSISGRNEGPVTARKLGRQPLPQPRRLEPYELANPVNHSEWVEITGIVHGLKPARERFGADQIAVEISNSAGSFEAVVHAPETVRDRFTDLIGAVVRCRGIYQSISGHFRRLIGVRMLVQDYNDISIVDPGLGNFARIPLRQINSILKFEPGATTRQRVLGTVTYSDPGRGFFMRDSSGSLWVNTPQKEAVWPGTHVQAVGFPSERDGFPALFDAVFEVQGMSNRPPALTTSLRGGLSGIYHGSLVRIRGTVADTLMHPGSQNLLLRADDSFFQVRLLRNKAIPLASLPERGSVLDVTGICFNEFRRKRELATDSEKRFRTISFHLLLQSPEDITIISKPPFWSIERVIWATLFLIGALASALAWINALRRQVTRQTVIIEDKIARETVMEERTRIARELHDTLEQELAGIQMQLDAASGHLKLAPDSAKETLDMARALLRHSRHETRRSVWDLRSTALETGNLQRAFAEVLDMVHGESKVDIRISTLGKPVRLSASVENNVLRIGQEAVNNSIEHARPRTIRVLLQYYETAITLKITDDGAGFDTAGPDARREGHFGLIGMRERARKVGGHLEIWSAPGEGTTISLTVPLPQGTTPVRQPGEKLPA